MSGGSWTHRAVRPLIRPMIGTWVRPNHLTVVRLATGIGAGLCIATGTPAGMGWGGGWWLVSALLDRADGELARLGGLSSRTGHVFDYYSDFAVNTWFFVAAGIGVRHSFLGRWAIPLGLLAGLSLLGASVFGERIERRGPPGTHIYAGRWGVDPDDALFVMAPIAWLGWLAPILIGAASGAFGFMLVALIRLARLRAREAAGQVRPDQTLPDQTLPDRTLPDQTLNV